MPYVYYGVCSPEGELLSGEKDVCYASIYGASGLKPQIADNKNNFYTLFEVGNKATIRCANWYFKTYAWNCIPEHVKEAITVRRLFTKNHRKAGMKKIPWIEVVADPRKISMNDLIILLFLLRMPQEHPQCIREMYMLYSEIKMSLDLSFFYGSFLTNNNNHSFISPYVFCGNKQPQEWNLRDIWEKIPRTLPISKNGNKTIHINTKFSGDIVHGIRYDNRY